MHWVVKPWYVIMELDNNGNFKKYVLKYWHEAQPRNDGRGKAQSSPLISAAEGNSLHVMEYQYLILRQ